MHNEGNISKVLRREKVVIITGIDKIYPNLEEVMNMIKILSLYAAGIKIPSFIEIISGISKTADIEKKLIRGVHNPKEVHLILLDNGRRRIAKSRFKEILYCINCGNCLVSCPVYNVIGNKYGIENFLGGKGLAYYSLKNRTNIKLLEYCLSCKKCRKSCPLNIDIPNIIKEIRSNKAFTKELFFFLKSHIIWLLNAINVKLNEFLKSR